ncbi:unnamed protein product [Caenorhabditis sp. 36 PRJEB53466]|nr:unnamed protein product [Caenorhabditis sp. 36 PRJEB53466]
MKHGMSQIKKLFKDLNAEMIHEKLLRCRRLSRYLEVRVKTNCIALLAYGFCTWFHLDMKNVTAKTEGTAQKPVLTILEMRELTDERLKPQQPSPPREYLHCWNREDNVHLFRGYNFSLDMFSQYIHVDFKFIARRVDNSLQPPLGAPCNNDETKGDIWQFGTCLTGTGATEQLESQGNIDEILAADFQLTIRSSAAEGPMQTPDCPDDQSEERDLDRHVLRYLHCPLPQIGLTGHHRAVIKCAEWSVLKKSRHELANELLEVVLARNPANNVKNRFCCQFPENHLLHQPPSAASTPHGKLPGWIASLRPDPCSVIDRWSHHDRSHHLDHHMDRRHSRVFLLVVSKPTSTLFTDGYVTSTINVAVIHQSLQPPEGALCKNDEAKGDIWQFGTCVTGVCFLGTTWQTKSRSRRLNLTNWTHHDATEQCQLRGIEGRKSSRLQMHLRKKTAITGDVRVAESTFGEEGTKD